MWDQKLFPFSRILSYFLAFVQNISFDLWELTKVSSSVQCYLQIVIIQSFAASSNCSSAFAVQPPFNFQNPHSVSYVPTALDILRVFLFCTQCNYYIFLRNNFLKIQTIWITTNVCPQKQKIISVFFFSLIATLSSVKENFTVVISQRKNKIKLYDNIYCVRRPNNQSHSS